MAVKIRLSRHGKKNAAFFHIVVADSRAPRDGRYIDKIGSYNPNTNPATIELNIEKAAKWLFNGAQPSDTCRRILSYKGVLLRKHLQEGVNKGAITQETADQKWNAWVAEKESKVVTKTSGLAKDSRDAKKVAIEAEAKVNEKRAAELAKKKEDERKAAEAAAREANAEAVAQSAPAEEAPVAEEAPAAEAEETTEA